jgi:hypothetical protein
MKPTTKLRAVVAILLLVNTGIAAAANTQPNIVYIMADDHSRLATGCYGGSFIQTPNVDRLAREGVRFDH